MRFKILVVAFFVCFFKMNLLAHYMPGAVKTDEYLTYLEGKNVGLVVNHSSRIGEVHLIDTLLALNIKISRLYTPEHGLRGDEDAGAHVNNSVDTKTGIEIISLYGNNKKPSNQSLAGIEIMVFDMQDLGARFYTYISTMHYVMEACAENNIPLIILDRSNPNIKEIDGPVLKDEWRSFVGMHNIPVLYGMTYGELAQMINGEGWLKDSTKCDIEIIKCKGKIRRGDFAFDVPPSPNIPNEQTARLYPSLCLFEATNVSVARGTSFPFLAIGYPGNEVDTFCFTPQSIIGMSTKPKFENQLCCGLTFQKIKSFNGFDIRYLHSFYHQINNHGAFISSENFFYKLSGTDELLKQLKDGMTVHDIRESWHDDLKIFKQKRKKYLIY